MWHEDKIFQATGQEVLTIGIENWINIWQFLINIFVHLNKYILCTMIKYFRQLDNKRRWGHGRWNRKLDKYIWQFWTNIFVHLDKYVLCNDKIFWRKAGMRFRPLKEILLCFVQAWAPQYAPTKFLRIKFWSGFKQVQFYSNFFYIFNPVLFALDADQSTENVILFRIYLCYP